MTAGTIELARAIAKMERCADLLIEAAHELSASGGYDPEHELDTARELHLQALMLRLRLETEKQTSVLH